MEKRHHRFTRTLLIAGALGACGQEGTDLDGAGQRSVLADGPSDPEVLADEPSAPGCIDAADLDAPVLTSHTLQLWPPNHKFHEIAVADCVSAVDNCSGTIQGEFIWASSDEPVDDKGDGHHAPDIQLSDCGKIAVRAERAGPQNGRVYTLGVRVVDAVGNASEGQCKVIVDHDQRGVQGADDGESYRITFDGSQGGPICDGRVEPPPVSEPPGEQPPGMTPPPAPPIVEDPPAEPPVEEPPVEEPPPDGPVL